MIWQKLGGSDKLIAAKKQGYLEGIVSRPVIPAKDNNHDQNNDTAE